MKRDCYLVLQCRITGRHNWLPFGTWHLSGMDRYRSSHPVTAHPLIGARSSGGPVGNSPSSDAGIATARPARYPRAEAALADGTANLTPASVTRNSDSPPTPGAAWDLTNAPPPGATLTRLAVSGLLLTPGEFSGGGAAGGGTAKTNRGGAPPAL